MSGLVRMCAVFLLGAALSGCAPRRADLVLDTASVPAAELVRLMSENDDRIAGLAGSGSVAFESPEMSGSAFFTVHLRKPDSLLIRFEGPFGMDAGFFFLSRTTCVMYNRLDNLALTGVPTTAGIRSIIPLDLTVDQIVDAFTGTFRPPVDTPPDEYAIDGDRFLLRYNSPTERQTLLVDPASRLVTRYLVERAGRTVFEAEASLPEDQDGLFAPRRIVATLPTQAGRLSIYYSSLTLNPSALSFAHTIPASARLRPLTPP